MRVLAHILLAFVAIGLQRGLDALLTVGAGRVDLVMIAASFTAVCLPRATGPLAALLIGLAYDLSGSGPLGTYGAALGIAGLVASVPNPTRWGRILGAIISGVVVACAVVWLLGALRGVLREEEVRDSMSASGMITTALLSSLMAIAASWPLWKWRKTFIAEGPRL